MIKIAEPRVYLIGTQSVNEDEVARFLQDESVESWTTDTDVAGQKLVEIAGRVCYMSFAKPRPGGNKAYIDHILEVGHGSVLEHAVFTLLITGVSRSLTHELVRHRAGFGFSQLSQRYVDEKDCAFVMPPAIQSRDLQETWIESMESAHQAYIKLASELDAAYEAIEDRTLRRKRAREAARSVLPNAVETKITVTGNARAWRHFIELRGSVQADQEICRLARLVLLTLGSAAQDIFGDYELDDAGSVETKNRKV